MTDNFAPNHNHTINLGELLRKKLARDDATKAHKQALIRRALSLLALELEREIADGSVFAQYDLMRVISMIEEQQ